MNIIVTVSLALLLAIGLGLLAFAALRLAWRSLGPQRFCAFLAAAVVAAVVAQKVSIAVDSYLADAGCYATNDVFHVAVSNAPNYSAIDFSACPVLVYARQHGQTNAADWTELTPRRTFGGLPADYAIANATNFDYLVYLDYVPPSPVHTNGVFELHGFTIDGFTGGRAVGFVNSRVATIGDYWFWPSEIVRVSKNPQSVWTPQTGIWYGSFASNGYANGSSGKDYQTFTTNSYHNFNQGGYSMVQFFALPAGVYTLSFDYVCEVQTDNANVSVFQYVRDGAAYKHGGALTRNVSREQHEEYKSEAHTFTAPADVLICCYISGLNTNGHRGADIWNVHLVKLP